jgi:hypothetical protein
VSVALRAPQSSGERKAAFQASAWRARRGEGCSIFGFSSASVTWKCLPWKVVRSWVHRPLMIRAASSICSRRAAGDRNGKPYAANSSSCQPAPMASSMRPPERWSMVVATLARTAGLR